MAPRAFFVMTCVIAIGCGQSREAEVSGKITFAGQPVQKGAISFFPVDGKSSTSGCVIDKGEYKAKVPFGEMLVRITAPKIVGKRKLYADDPKSPEMDLTVEAIPERYNEKSELVIDVREPILRKDFDLTK